MNKFIQHDLTADIVKTNNPRIGVIALSTDFTIEQDYRNICHQLPVDIFVNRIPFENPLNHENYLKMADYISDVSSQILPSEEIDIIAYGCTSGTIAIGSDRIKEEVNKTKPKAKVTTPITAALKAFKHLGLKNIAVLTPYPKDVNATVYDYLTDHNIGVESFSSFNLEYDSEIAQVSLESLEKEISKIDLSNVDGLFVSCTALPALSLIDQLEKKLGKVVLSSNQTLIWDTLKEINCNKNIDGFGQLFKD